MKCWPSISKHSPTKSNVLVVLERLLSYALVVLWIPTLSAAPKRSLQVTALRCEFRINPAGLDVLQPRLSWILTSEQRGEQQKAFQVLAASSAEGLEHNGGDLWDSGKVLSDQTIEIIYQGKPLSSRSRVWWKVRVWGKSNRVSDWSAPAQWSMGLLNQGDWRAQWIADPAATSNANAAVTNTSLPAILMRKSFRLDQPFKNATAYVTALGLYELRINGQRVGEQLLAPEWTSYSKRVQYQTYQVTDLLRRGSNVVAALVGEGWYEGRLMAVGRCAYGAFPKFLLQVEVELDNGMRQLIPTDDSWRCSADGPIRSAGIYDGEVFDAARTLPGWDMPEFNDSSWARARAFPLDNVQLVWQPNEPIVVEQELTCRKLTEPKPAVYVFDLGQNMVGWCRLKAQGTRGKPVVLRHAEALNEDGTIYTANLRGAPQVDSYVPAADGQFTFEPHFTSHGFRFVEVSGLAAPPEPNALIGQVFHSASPFVGKFECSDASLNQLMHNIVWTARANVMSSPNDCPQRDERFGWMGDIQAFAQTAVFNMELAAFFRKFARDTRDDQAADGRFPDFAPHPGDPNEKFSGAPAWADAGVLVPWCAYQNYGDTRLLAEQFDAARRWVDYIHRLNPGLIWVQGRNNDYNDWLNGDWIKQTDWPTQGGSVPKEVFATAFFAHSTELVAKMAGVLGKMDQALSYRTLFERIKAAFNNRFVAEDGTLEGDTQAGYALALQFDLLPEPLRGKALERLLSAINRYHNHLSTGIQTTHRAMLELSRDGYNSLAWQLLTNRTFPSWLYMVDNGATTIWERWDGYVQGRGFQDPGMNSLNHWAFGAVGEWMWRYVIGLNPDEGHPGWKHFLVAPRPDGGVTWAKGEFNSIRGPIRVDWACNGDQFTLETVVPVNTTATVILPARDLDGISESGKSISNSRALRLVQAQDGFAVLELTSGQYHFKSSLSGNSL